MAFIDKINPDIPEGRLLIRDGRYILKDPQAEVSSTLKTKATMQKKSIR